MLGILFDLLIKYLIGDLCRIYSNLRTYYGKGCNSFLDRDLSYLRPLRAQAKSHDHDIVRVQKKVFQHTFKIM